MLNVRNTGELYSPTPRPDQGIGELEYPFHDRTVTVTRCGRTCVGRRKINLSVVFAGQDVGVREVSEKIWLVSIILAFRRYLKQGEVTVQIEIENRVTGPVQVDNVIGEIPGREKPDEWVLVGAHLDSWDLGTGAQDNATGSVMVLEAARSIAALPLPPRRSIRFALWAGEEPGIPGSAVYVKAHREELKNCVAALNIDNGAGHPLGWKVARDDVRKAMQPISEGFLKELGGDGLSSIVDCGSDHCPFLLEGIPVLNLWVDTSLYSELHHKGSDTFEKIDPLHFKADAAIVAVTAYLLAEHQQPIAPHASEADIAALLKRAGLDSDVVHALWRP